MFPKNDNLPLWLRANAWREIFARVFEGVETKINVTPEWLVNPATKRHLKLDLLYPEIGVAVRFEGLEAKQRHRRPSLEEEEQQRVREDARVEMCRRHDIDLIVVDLAATDPKTVFQEIDMALSRAGQRLKTRDARLAQGVSRTRSAAASLARRIGEMGQLKLYADLWEDRQYRPTALAETAAPVKAALNFREGMEVEHAAFGPGVVLSVTASGNDTLVTVDFITAGRKTLALSLVGDKLHPR